MILESINGVSGSNIEIIVEKNETALDETFVKDAQSSDETIYKSFTEEVEEGTNGGDVSESPMKT